MGAEERWHSTHGRLVLYLMLAGLIAIASIGAVTMLSGCSSAQQPQPSPAAVEMSQHLDRDQRQIAALTQIVMMYSRSLNQFIALCPKTPRSAPLEAGVQMCVAEIQASQNSEEKKR